MDPTLKQLADDLSTSFDTLKASQTAVAPLQSAADAANADLTAGKQEVITATADVDAKLQALIDYIHTGENPNPTPIPEPTPGPEPAPAPPPPPQVTGRRKL